MDIGRDGCRVPLPWSGSQAPFGFSPDGASAAPWLPQPTGWAEHTAAALDAEPDSILRFYRTALAARHAEPALLAEHGQPVEWLSGAEEPVLHFRRGSTFDCLVNLGAQPVALPAGRQVVLASAALPTGEDILPTDTAVWLRA